MKWKALTKKALQSLKVQDQKILVVDIRGPVGGEFEYDVLEYLDLTEIYAVEDEKFNYHWANLLNRNSKYEYDDSDVLHAFTHYMILRRPEFLVYEVREHVPKDELKIKCAKCAKLGEYKDEVQYNDQDCVWCEACKHITCGPVQYK